MSCEETRRALGELGAEHALPQASRDHLTNCGECRRLAARVAHLDATWRTMPVPASAEPAKQVFLRRLVRRPAVAGVWLARSTIRWALAASFFLAVVLSGWLILPTSEASAAEVLDSLVEWNLALAAAPQVEREQLIAGTGKLEEAVRRAELTQEDRDFAHALLERGAALARQDDPLSAADHFDGLAELAHVRLDQAVRQGQTHDAARWARRYASLDERGVKASLDRGKKKVLNDRQAHHLEKIAQRGQHRRQAVQKMVDDAPEAARPELRRNMNAGKKAARAAK